MVDLEIVTPTVLEYWMTRARLPRAHVSWAGVGLARRTPGRAQSLLLVGLAGGLPETLDSGQVLVPSSIRAEAGVTVQCDPELVEAMVRGAHRLGFEADTRPMLTASTLVTGQKRAQWAARGYAGADMEAALLAQRCPRFGTVRVVLDTPKRSISESWTRSGLARMSASVWRELPWLAVRAPAYALRAASVARMGLIELQAARSG